MENPALRKESSGKRSRCGAKLSLIVCAALALRLLAMLFMYQEHLDPSRNHWHFAWETGMIAGALASGRGFSSPFANPTGPTAWMGPMFPWLLAQVFRVFGVYSRSSAIAILLLNSLFSALTCIPVFLIAKRTFGARVATWSAWAWAVFPYAVYLGAGRIWENSLSTLLITFVFWFVLRLSDGAPPTAWAGFGLLVGLAALSNPIVLGVLPFLLAWACRQLRECKQSWKLSLALAMVALMLVVTPWEIRNYRVFGKFIPIRGNFWAEMRFGNTGDLSDIYPDWAHPSTSESEWQEYARLGEVAYMERERGLALDFIRRYPGAFTSLTLRRVGYTWTGFWSRHPVYMANEPFQIPNTVFCSSLTVLMLLGLRKSWRSRARETVPLVLMIAVLPLTYYITHPCMDYRHFIDPEIVILAVFWLASRSKRARAGRGPTIETDEVVAGSV
jgi:4-amino-4-deoxy-L-arabinose transferase-like glycosyltransferase